MASFIKNLLIKIGVYDNTEQGAKEVEKRLKKVGNTADTFVGKKATAALSQFNESTEKSRQLLTAFGGTAGAAAGNVLYYTGTIGALVGKMDKFKLAATGVVGVIGLVGFKMLSTARGPMVEFGNKLKEVLTQNDQVVQGIKDKLDAEAKRNLTVFEQDKLSLKMEATKLETRKKRLEVMKKEINEARNAEGFSKGILGTASWLDKNIGVGKSVLDYFAGADVEGNLAKVNAQLNETNRLYNVLGERIQKGESAYKGSGGKGGKGRKPRKTKPQIEEFKPFSFTNEDARMGQAANLERETAWQQHMFKLNDIERQYYLMSDTMAEENAARKEALLQRQYDAQTRYLEKAMAKEQEQEAQRKQAIQDGIGLAGQALDVGMQIGEMYDIWGESSAKTEEQRQKAASKRMAFEAGVNMALEIAKAAASFAEQNYIGGAAHLIAAGLYGAALGKALGGVSGGGGGGGGGGGASKQYQREKEKEDNEDGQKVVIYVGGHMFLGKDGDKDLFNRVNDYSSSQNPGRDQDRL